MNEWGTFESATDGSQVTGDAAGAVWTVHWSGYWIFAIAKTNDGGTMMCRNDDDDDDDDAECRIIQPYIYH